MNHLTKQLLHERCFNDGNTENVLLTYSQTMAANAEPKAFKHLLMSLAG